MTEYATARYPNGWTLTGHAQHRMDEMGLTAAQIFRAVANPDLAYPGRSGPGGQQRRVLVAQGLAVVVALDHRTVITVLWDGATQRTFMPPAA